MGRAALAKVRAVGRLLACSQYGVGGERDCVRETDMSEHIPADAKLSFEPGTPVWVHTDGWAGHLKFAGVLLKVNPKRSRVRVMQFRGAEAKICFVPNRAITKRHPYES